MLTSSETLYLKAIYSLLEKGKIQILTNDISEITKTKPASVTDMLKKLNEKELIIYEKYHGCSLTEQGKKTAIQLVRNQKLWEIFLMEKLSFTEPEILNVITSFDSIQSEHVLHKMVTFLQNPKSDIYGNPLLNENGTPYTIEIISLENLPTHTTAKVTELKKDNPSFLKYMEKINIKIGCKIKIIEKIEYDNSFEILIHNSQKIIISLPIAQNIKVCEI
ncbi:MAG: metal-dependent transcriptional regulator [Chitinophagaceae bacterium]|nr:metal-dependent transcriptional regulator [Chitinophagaceae bacterium]